ncbi:S8 family serine peptidase [Bacillus sp. JJ864]|uniref:S8 family peptidase n=1 Tax=Bacillus sp. JJ864 TaxID=3122975 RepID=UPI002FFE3851
MKLLKSLLFFIALLFIIPINFVNASDNKIDYYTILLKNKNDYENFKKTINKNDVEIIYSVEEVGMMQVKTNEDTIKKLGFSSFVKSYGKSIRTVKNNLNSNPLNNDTIQNSQWDMKKITNNGESYKIFSGTKNVSVGIIDTGLDIHHPDLKENIVNGSKNLVPIGGFRGQELNENGDINYLNDLSGHGTYTAGQIAANGKLKGVAPGIGIKAYKVFGQQSAESIWVIKAIIEASKDDVDVINLSLGDYLLNGNYSSNNKIISTDIPEIEGYQRAINFAIKSGSVVVAAAGNDGLDVKDKIKLNNFFKSYLELNGLEKINFTGEIYDIPASLSGVVTVSSTGPTNELSIFSNYGKNFVDIVAPGGDFRLLNKYGSEFWSKNKLYEKEQILTTAPNGDYIYQSGNSLAAPKVSGTLALIIDKNHFKNKPNKAINFLYNYGVDKNSNFGHGTLNVYKAVTH